jgi:hypothetical protein
VNGNTCGAYELRSGVVIVFDLKKFFRRWEGWQAFSESIFIVCLNRIVGRENWSGHFVSSVIIDFLIGGSGNVGRRCGRLLCVSGFSFLRILIGSFVEMSETMGHEERNKKYT